MDLPWALGRTSSPTAAAAWPAASPGPPAGPRATRVFWVKKTKQKTKHAFNFRQVSRKFLHQATKKKENNQKTHLVEIGNTTQEIHILKSMTSIFCTYGKLLKVVQSLDFNCLVCVISEFL